MSETYDISPEYAEGFDYLEEKACAQNALITRDTRTGQYILGRNGSMSRIIAAHVATGTYASGAPRPI